MINNNTYLYLINYPTYEEELCKMEMRSLFNINIDKKYFFTDIYVDPSRSPFVKEMISIIYEEETLEKIVEKILSDELSYDDFKVIYVKAEEGNTTYKERLDSMKSIGFVVNGEPDMHNPKVCLGITKVNNKWIFGEYFKNNYEWHIHDKKPYSYSNSLGIRLGRALVNIGAKNNKDVKLIDPCCGVGTVVIEGLSMDLNIKGYDINRSICSNAKRNLEFFGYEDVIERMDIKDIDEKYDVAIIDLPYGLFTPITPNEQIDIIDASRKIADKLILVTFEDMDELVIRSGFEIIDRCKVSKGKFIRYISICK